MDIGRIDTCRQRVKVGSVGERPKAVVAKNADPSALAGLLLENALEPTKIAVRETIKGFSIARREWSTPRDWSIRMVLDVFGGLVGHVGRWLSF
jgi:hypothetical protein